MLPDCSWDRQAQVEASTNKTGCLTLLPCEGNFVMEFFEDILARIYEENDKYEEPSDDGRKSEHDQLGAGEPAERASVST
jgi:hypothetical protein